MSDWNGKQISEWATAAQRCLVEAPGEETSYFAYEADAAARSRAETDCLRSRALLDADAPWR